MNYDAKLQFSRSLIRFGMILFTIGLLTGFLIPFLQNPRMGLSSHMEALMNGMFLILAGLIWPKLRLSNRTQKWGFGISLYGTYINWFTTFMASIWGAGASMMPIAGTEFFGAEWQEGVIKFGLISLSFAMVVACGIILWGLRGKIYYNESLEPNDGNN
jgi:hydroxylaminobenzene mutase